MSHTKTFTNINNFFFWLKHKKKMFSSRQIFSKSFYNSAVRNYKVAVVGASGGIGKKKILNLSRTFLKLSKILSFRSTSFTSFKA